MSAHLIIVGAGQAAAQSVLTLTQKRYAGRITVVGDEPYPPYQRPPLSKKFLSGDLERQRLFIRPASFYEQHGVTLSLGSRAEPLLFVDAFVKRNGCSRDNQCRDAASAFVDFMNSDWALSEVLLSKDAEALGLNPIPRHLLPAAKSAFENREIDKDHLYK